MLSNNWISSQKETKEAKTRFPVTNPGGYMVALKEQVRKDAKGDWLQDSSV